MRGVGASLMLAASVLGTPAVTTAARISPADAARVFDRAHTLCKADAGKLWSVSLCVPMIVVEPKSRDAFAFGETPDAKDDRTPRRLAFPADIPLSTVPVDYRGTRAAESRCRCTAPSKRTTLF